MSLNEKRKKLIDKFNRNFCTKLADISIHRSIFSLFQGVNMFKKYVFWPSINKISPTALTLALDPHNDSINTDSSVF